MMFVKSMFRILSGVSNGRKSGSIIIVMMVGLKKLGFCSSEVMGECYVLWCINCLLILCCMIEFLDENVGSRGLRRLNVRMGYCCYCC